MRIKQTPGGGKPPTDAAKADATKDEDKDKATPDEPTKEPDTRSGAGRVKAAVAAAAATGDDKDTRPKADDAVKKDAAPAGQLSKDVSMARHHP